MLRLSIGCLAILGLLLSLRQRWKFGLDIKLFKGTGPTHELLPTAFRYRVNLWVVRRSHPSSALTTGTANGRSESHPVNLA